MQQKSRFNGSGNVRDYYLKRFDIVLIQKLLPVIPSSITSAHVTLVTIPASIANIIIGLLAHSNFSLIGLLAIPLIIHHICDSLDGALGRQRREGLVLWGYYMDKFVDFLYVCSLSLCFIVVAPQISFFATLLLVGYGGMMVQTFLLFGAIGKL